MSSRKGGGAQNGTSVGDSGSGGEEEMEEDSGKHVRALYAFNGTNEDEVGRNRILHIHSLIPKPHSQLFIVKKQNFHTCTNTPKYIHSQLQFEKGDLITVLKMVDGGWWEGVCNGKVGWFPGNYVEEFQGGTIL